MDEDLRAFCNNCGFEGPSCDPRLIVSSVNCPKCKVKVTSFYDELAYQRAMDYLSDKFKKYEKE